MKSQRVDLTLLSAQVIMRPLGRGRIRSAEITSENINRIIPVSDNAEKVRRFFSKIGFEVGSLFGNSFSLTGKRALFEKVFHVRVNSVTSGALVVLKNGVTQSEFPLDRIPSEIKELIEAIAFTSAPAFGPSNP